MKQKQNNRLCRRSALHVSTVMKVVTIPDVAAALGYVLTDVLKEPTSSPSTMKKKEAC